MALDSKVEEVLNTVATSLDLQYRTGMKLIDKLPDSMVISKNAMRKPYAVMHELHALLTSVLFTGDTLALRERISDATGTYFDPITPIGWEIGLAHLLSHDLKTFS